METIKKTAEYVEKRIGEALGSRDSAVGSMSIKKPGLGPPDMCWLQKRVRKAFRKKTEVRGSYHWVLGLDMYGEECVSTYLRDMVNGMEKPGFLQGLVPREYNIDRGVYCCHDPFAFVDIWCDVETEGKMMARAIDSQGDIRDVTPDMWRGARLGCFLRSELYDDATTFSMTKFIRRLQPFHSHEAEENFMDSTISLYADGLIQQCLERLQWDKGGGLDPEDLDIVAGTILHYFRRDQRWQKALQFFTRLQEVYAPATVYLAAVYRELENPDGAMTVLQHCVEDRGHSDLSLLIAYGKELLVKGDITRAFAMAKKSIGKAQTARPAWVLLQDCFSASRDYALALKTLNLMPGPVMPPHDKELLFQQLPPKPKTSTRPNQQQYLPDVSELRKTTQEGKEVYYRQVGKLPAMILAPEQYGNSSILSNNAPTCCTRATARKAYKILLNIVRDVGWEQFIELRSQLFTVADVSLQGQASTILKARKSVGLAALGDENWVAVVIKLLNKESSRGEEGGEIRLVSVTLEVRGQKGPVLNKSSSSESDLTAKVSEFSFSNADGNLNTRSSGDRKSEVARNEDASSKIEGNEEVKTDDKGAPANGSVSNRGGQEEVDLQIQQAPESSGRAAEKEEGQQTPLPRPFMKTVAFPKGALESAEYLEKLRAREDDNGVVDPSPRALLVRSAGVSPRPPVERKKESVAPPVSPASSKSSQRAGTPDNTGDRWLVREVSHGIKDRVRYFESIASKRVKEEESKIPAETEEAAVQALRPVSSRKGTSMTMMEFFTAGWDETLASTPEDVTTQESFALTENSEAEAEAEAEAEESAEDEGIQEGVNADDTASQLVVKQGWLGVDWGSRKTLSFAERRRDSQSDVEASREHDSQPTSPFMMEAQTQGLRVASSFKFGSSQDDGDGSWIVQVLQELQECECSEWLDEIILALWEDLSMYTELRKIDRKWKARAGKAQAELILGTEEENYSLGSDDDSPRQHDMLVQQGGSVPIPKSTSGDWMRRGLLCERLERIPEAEQAYRVCLFKNFNMTALLGLIRIYSSWGWCKEAMQVLNRLAEYHDRCHDFSPDPYAPKSIARAVSQLVMSVGNMEVRSCAAKCHAMVKFVVDDVLKWQLRSGLEQRG